MTTKNLFLSRAILWPVLVVTGLSGCASYQTHFGVFDGTNSSGERRQVRVSWESAEYPGWWPRSDRASPVRIETQCSSRVWLLYDDSHSEAGACGSGVRACADPQLDRSRAGGVATAESICMKLTDESGSARITDLGARLSLTVSCLPVSSVRSSGGEAENYDYLRASVVPYNFQVRKARSGSFDARLPVLSTTECDEPGS